MILRCKILLFYLKIELNQRLVDDEGFPREDLEWSELVEYKNLRRKISGIIIVFLPDIFGSIKGKNQIIFFYLNYFFSIIYLELNNDHISVMKFIEKGNH